MKTLMLRFPDLYQFIRYGFSGLINNLLGYFVYLVLTFFWLKPKTAIILIYFLAGTTGYFLHMKYSFAYHGSNINVLLRYILTYMICYVINLLVLVILTDVFHFSHQLVQALAIFIVAIPFFFVKVFCIS